MPRLGAALFLLAAPLLTLGAGVTILMGWGDPELDRWGRAVSACGVAAYTVFMVALIACGDIEGGIPVGPQVFWQAVWTVAVMAAVPLLTVGGALVLARRRQPSLTPPSRQGAAATEPTPTDGMPSTGTP